MATPKNAGGQGQPNTQTPPDMRLPQNKTRYGTVANRDATAPRGKNNPANKVKKGKQS